MCSRTSYYLAVLELAKVMSVRQDSCGLLWKQIQGVSVASLLQGMLQPAQQYAKVCTEDQQGACSVKHSTNKTLKLCKMCQIRLYGQLLADCMMEALV
jgi:hypothetical protein